MDEKPREGSFNKLYVCMYVCNKKWFPISSRFRCDRSTIVTSKKALFSVISLLGDLVIAYGTNLVAIVLRSFWKFYVQCPVHTGILTTFTGIFRVKPRAATFCFLTVVFFKFSVKFLVLRPRFHHRNFRSLHFHSGALLQPNQTFSSF